MYILDALPGCNDTHPTPGNMDNRFGKVWILSNLMRQLITYNEKDEIQNNKLEWLLWIDSDILILDDYSKLITSKEKAVIAGNISQWPSDNFILNLIELYNNSSIDFIVADQRDSQHGDINAGLMLMRVNKWNTEFFDVWWNHKDAQKV